MFRLTKLTPWLVFGLVAGAIGRSIYNARMGCHSVDCQNFTTAAFLLYGWLASSAIVFFNGLPLEKGREGTQIKMSLLWGAVLLPVFGLLALAAVWLLRLVF